MNSRGGDANLCYSTVVGSEELGPHVGGSSSVDARWCGNCERCGGFFRDLRYLRANSISS